MMMKVQPDGAQQFSATVNFKAVDVFFDSSVSKTQDLMFQKSLGLFNEQSFTVQVDR